MLNIPDGGCSEGRTPVVDNDQLVGIVSPATQPASAKVITGSVTGASSQRVAVSPRAAPILSPSAGRSGLFVRICRSGPGTYISVNHSGRPERAGAPILSQY